MIQRTQFKQKGIASILVTVVILVAATIMVTFANRSIIFDIRSSANEARQKEAFSIAESGLNFAFEKLEQNFRTSYDGSSSANAATSLATILANSQVSTKTKVDGSNASSTEAGFTVTITDSGVSFGGIPIYTVVATGTTADGTGTAIAHRQVTMVNAFSGSTPDVPVIVAGAVGTSGNFNIVANPNGGDVPGAPVSIWTNDTITASSSSATCHTQFYTGGQCSNPSGNAENITRGTNPSTAITAYSSAYPDLLPNSSSFPSDLFNFMFGLPKTNWEAKKIEVENKNQTATSCTSVTTAGTAAGATYPIWWVTGDCALNGGTIGSEDDPVILIIDDGEFSAQGNTKVYGVVYLFNNPSTSGTPSAQLGGTMEIEGAFVSDVGGNAMQGSYSVVYNPTLMGKYSSSGSSYSFSVIPNTWRDFQ